MGCNPECRNGTGWRPLVLALLTFRNPLLRCAEAWKGKLIGLFLSCSPSTKEDNFLFHFGMPAIYLFHGGDANCRGIPPESECGYLTLTSLSVLSIWKDGRIPMGFLRKYFGFLCPVSAAYLMTLLDPLCSSLVDRNLWCRGRKETLDI
jgi:hypothetical protein